MLKANVHELKNVETKHVSYIHFTSISKEGKGNESDHMMYKIVKSKMRMYPQHEDATVRIHVH